MLYYIFEFILIAVLSYFFYYKFSLKRAINKKTKPIEFAYLETTYKLKLDKINTKKLSKCIALCNALIIATTVIVIEFIDSLPLKLLVGFTILISLIVVVYYFIGLYYKKKGMTKKCTNSQK